MCNIVVRCTWFNFPIICDNFVSVIIFYTKASFCNDNAPKNGFNRNYYFITSLNDQVVRASAFAAADLSFDSKLGRTNDFKIGTRFTASLLDAQH